MFGIDPVYLPISEKLLSKLRREQFVELADLVFENLKGQEAEPQTYVDGTLLVSAAKKKVFVVLILLSQWQVNPI